MSSCCLLPGTSKATHLAHTSQKTDTAVIRCLGMGHWHAGLRDRLAAQKACDFAIQLEIQT